MAAFPDLAAIGALLGEPSRTAMLTELCDGRALTAGELAARAGVTASTASAHLARLVKGGLLIVLGQGRHRYYRLAGPGVASALEALALLTPDPVARNAFDGEVLTSLRFARTCYGHLAGRLGVALRGQLLERNFIEEYGVEHQVTTAGERWFAAIGVDLKSARLARRSFARACLDWSERRPHLAGAVGDALLTSLIERDWIRRRHDERAVELTEAGRRGLSASVGLHLPSGARALVAGGASARP